MAGRLTYAQRRGTPNPRIVPPVADEPRPRELTAAKAERLPFLTMLSGYDPERVARMRSSVLFLDGYAR